MMRIIDDDYDNIDCNYYNLVLILVLTRIMLISDYPARSVAIL